MLLRGTASLGVKLLGLLAELHGDAVTELTGRGKWWPLDASSVLLRMEGGVFYICFWSGFVFGLDCVSVCFLSLQFLPVVLVLHWSMVLLRSFFVLLGKQQNLWKWVLCPLHVRDLCHLWKQESTTKSWSSGHPASTADVASGAHTLAGGLAMFLRLIRFFFVVVDVCINLKKTTLKNNTSIYFYYVDWDCFWVFECSFSWASESLIRGHFRTFQRWLGLSDFQKGVDANGMCQEATGRFFNSVFWSHNWWARNYWLKYFFA